MHSSEQFAAVQPEISSSREKELAASFLRLSQEIYRDILGLSQSSPGSKLNTVSISDLALASEKKIFSRLCSEFNISSEAKRAVLAPDMGEK